MPFLRGTTPIWITQYLPRRFKEWKACVVEIGQTAHKLETNARANFPMAEILVLYNCTDGSPSPFRQSRVVRFPCLREENMAMYHYTKSTRSQSLTVVERTISDLRA